MTNIYVGNLSYEATEDDLRQAFEAHGEVTSVAIIMDKMTGRSRGFGFVEMSDKNAANAAIQALNLQEIRGRAITVMKPSPKPRAEPAAAEAAAVAVTAAVVVAAAAEAVATGSPGLFTSQSRKGRSERGALFFSPSNTHKRIRLICGHFDHKSI